MDFSKAFDKVAPNRLNIISTRIPLRLHKLEWIRCFLSGRTQYYVVVHGTESDSPPVPFGVPQGPVLGPAMFLVYIYWLPKVGAFVYLLMTLLCIGKSRQMRTITH